MDNPELEAAEDRALKKAYWISHIIDTIATDCHCPIEHALQLLHATGDLPNLLRRYGNETVRPPDTPLEPTRRLAVTDLVDPPGWPV